MHTLHRLDRLAVILIAGAVGAGAVVPGWQLMTDGSVFGYRMPVSYLSQYWPFDGYTVAGLVLLVVVGGGGIATAAINVLSERAGGPAAVAMGAVLVGWIAGELVFLTQTMFLTWVILGAGLALIGLGLPYAVPWLRAAMRRPAAAG